jgi:hypothetical protein
VPIERLIDAFACALDKYAEKSRELSDFKYRNRRHAVDDEKLTVRHNICHEIYIDKIMELQEAHSKYNGAQNNQPDPQVMMPDSRKQRRNTTTDSGSYLESAISPRRNIHSTLGPLAAPVFPIPSQMSPARVRENIRRSVETLADLRCQPADVELPPRGHSIEQGNALGLGENAVLGRGDWENTLDPVYETRRLAEGRTTEWVGARQLEAPVGIERRFGPGHDEEARPRAPERSVSQVEQHRHARRVSIGERLMSAPEVQRLAYIPDLTGRSRDEQHDRRDEHGHRAEQYDHRDERHGGRSVHATVSFGERRRPEPGREVQRERYEVAPPTIRTPGPDVRVQLNPVTGRAPPRAELLTLPGAAPAPRPSRPRASTMTRSVSLQPPRPLESEYATPRISEPPTPYASTNASASHTPHSSAPRSLHSSPNPPQHPAVPSLEHSPPPHAHSYASAPVPSAQPTPYPAGQGRPAPIPWHPATAPAHPYTPASWSSQVSPAYPPNVAPQRTNTLF